MAIDPFTAFAGAAEQIAKTIGTIIATRRVRHMKAAIDAAERYIDINEKFGDNANLSAEDRLKLLRKFRKRFKKFN